MGLIMEKAAKARVHRRHAAWGRSLFAMAAFGNAGNRNTSSSLARWVAREALTRLSAAKDSILLVRPMGGIAGKELITGRLKMAEAKEASRGRRASAPSPRHSALIAADLPVNQAIGNAFLTAGMRLLPISRHRNLSQFQLPSLLLSRHRSLLLNPLQAMADQL